MKIQPVNLYKLRIVKLREKKYYILEVLYDEVLFPKPGRPGIMICSADHNNPQSERHRKGRLG